MKPYEGFRVLRVGWNGKGYLYKILGVNTYLNVGVGQVNLVQEDREKGGVGIKDTGEEAPEGPPEMDGIGWDLEVVAALIPINV